MPEKLIIKQARPIAREPFSRSPVSIIIPFHGCYEKVGKLVSSIMRVTRSNPYQICLVDDYSPNSSFINAIKDLPQVFALRTEKRLGFGGALEFGFKATQQPWVVFMHSDCVVEDPRWLVEMGRTLLKLKENNVKMVSARTNNPGEGCELLKSKREEIKEDIILKEGFLPLYCSMCHRELFSHIGGFIKNYPLCHYEDEELAYRMRHYGFFQAACGKSWVRHEGGATINNLCKINPSLIEELEKNRDLCVEDIRKLNKNHR